ncbi:hypothetical protein MPSEU_000479100 [Mayamaea pseudoterrestris]|nr:hypothetical protein MPSEU_000479100 [Mayamaea pseudoterrestris]
MRLAIPSLETKRELLSRASQELESYVIKEPQTKTLHAAFCCVCDGTPDEAYWHKMVSVTRVASLCSTANMRKVDLSDVYPMDLLNEYTAKHQALKDYVLSPDAYVNKRNEICVCRKCLVDLETNAEERKARRRPPRQSIANGYVIGHEPEELKCLNEVELALISKAKLHCQTWVFFGGCHKQIKGWTTLLKNHPETNVANMMQIRDSGLHGRLLVVLCGPFTSTQKAKVLQKTRVDPEKVLNAWNWLKVNNFRYRDLHIPDPDSLPVPRIVEDKVEWQRSVSVDVENEMSITHVFPDVTLPGRMNGTFQTQDEFRKYILEHNGGNYEAQMHARPSADRFMDFAGDTIADAFVLQFPYGFTGLADDPAVLKLKKRKSNTRYCGRKRIDVYKKYLRHRKSVFHGPMFVLVIENLILKEAIFKSVVIQCNIKQTDGRSIADKFGTMSTSQFEKAITDCQQQHGVNKRNTTEHRFLRSITAVCENLPHTNEASQDARKVYFSFLMKFGMPAIFLTVSPDDQRNYRIVVYALGKENYNPDSTVNVASLTDRQIIDNFRMRQDIRYEHPGLCAEEYERVVKAVVSHLFNWDIDNQCSKGIGIYSNQSIDEVIDRVCNFRSPWFRIAVARQFRYMTTHVRMGFEMIHDATSDSYFLVRRYKVPVVELRWPRLATIEKSPLGGSITFPLRLLGCRKEWGIGWTRLQIPGNDKTPRRDCFFSPKFGFMFISIDQVNFFVSLLDRFEGSDWEMEEYALSKVCE